jgi:hypothetical protein
VAAEPPAPRRRAARLAEHPQVVEAGVATALPVEPGDEPLCLVEHVLQAHHGGHGDVRRGGQAGRDQPHRRPLLRRPLLVHGQAAVIGGRVEPAQPLGIGRVAAGPLGAIRRCSASAGRASSAPLASGRRGTAGDTSCARTPRAARSAPRSTR